MIEQAVSGVEVYYAACCSELKPTLRRPYKNSLAVVEYLYLQTYYTSVAIVEMLKV